MVRPFHNTRNRAIANLRPFSGATILRHSSSSKLCGDSDRGVELFRKAAEADIQAHAVPGTR